MFPVRSRRRARPLAWVVVAATLMVATVGLTTSPAAAAPGSVIWAERYNGPDADLDRANAVAVSPDGSTVFVTGYFYSPVTAYDYGTVAYDAATGVVRWARRYNGPPSDPDLGSVSEANDIEVSPDGSRVFVTGVSDKTTDQDYATIAYDTSSGATLWTKRYDGPASGDVAYALGVSPNGAKVFVTGWSHGSTTNRDYSTVAYAASDGARSWVQRYDTVGDDVATALGVSPDGSTIFVSGYSRLPSASYDYATVAYDAGTGAQRWVRRYNDPIGSADQASAVGVSPDSSTVFVTGYSYQSTTEHDYTTIAYDAMTGARRWLKLYDGPGGATDFATALAVSPDGSSVFVTGQDYSYATGYDYGTVAYDASTGARLWAKRYAGTGSTRDEASDVGVTPDGSIVIVTGYSYRSTTSNDYTTIAYDAGSGSTLWSKRYDGPARLPDVANALDVSASAAFVTGYSYTRSGETDYATVAYALT